MLLFTEGSPGNPCCILDIQGGEAKGREKKGRVRGCWSCQRPSESFISPRADSTRVSERGGGEFALGRTRRGILGRWCDDTFYLKRAKPTLWAIVLSPEGTGGGVKPFLAYGGLFWGMLAKTEIPFWENVNSGGENVTV